MIPPQQTGYGQAAKLFHWLTVLIVMIVLTAGWLMVEETPHGDALQTGPFLWHKFFGLLVFGLSVLRLLWRQKNPPPPFPPSLPAWQRRIAVLTHAALYALLIILPLSGFLGLTFTGIEPGRLLAGLSPLPSSNGLFDLSSSGQMAGLLLTGHALLASVLVFLIALHIAAALKHHFVDRDDVLLRMAPLCLEKWLRRSRGEPAL